MPRLTKKLIESSPTTEKDHIIFDDELPGFGLRLLPSGRKIFIIQYRIGRRARRLTIGPYPIFIPETARTEAIKVLAAIRTGNDPMAKKKAYNASPTIRELADRYMIEHCKVRLKPSTWKSNEYLVKAHILSEFGNYKVLDVSRTDIASLHSKLSETPTHANRVLQVASKMFSLAELWGWRPEGSNPARRIEKYSEKKRERFLTKEETQRLGAVLEEQKLYPDENLAAVFAIQFLLLTGCRLGEILSLKWDYVDWPARCLRLPDSKTGAKTVYLGTHAVSVLQEIKIHPARPADNPYVIWGSKPGAPLNNLQKPWSRFRKLAGLEDVHIHDLRHSFASFAVNQRLSLPMIGKLLGHTQTQTTARYAHLMDNPMKEAADSVTDEIGALLAIKAPTEAAAAPPTEDATTEATAFIPKTGIPMPKYLTSDQAAQYLGLPPESMKDWRYRKLGPHYTKVGNRVRYRLEDLDDYLIQNAKPTIL